MKQEKYKRIIEEIQNICTFAPAIDSEEMAKKIYKTIRDGLKMKKFNMFISANHEFEVKDVYAINRDAAEAQVVKKLKEQYKHLKNVDMYAYRIREVEYEN